jgi:hypothetical protein
MALHRLSYKRDNSRLSLQTCGISGCLWIELPTANYDAAIRDGGQALETCNFDRIDASARRTGYTVLA